MLLSQKSLPLNLSSCVVKGCDDNLPQTDLCCQSVTENTTAGTIGQGRNWKVEVCAYLGNGKGTAQKDPLVGVDSMAGRFESRDSM